MLKLFKRRPKDELICADDLVGCLGKLPMHREFIKHGVVQPELASLDHWYQSAYHQLHQHYGVETKTLFSQMPLHNYLYLTSKNPKPMLGAIMASSDQSGRIYPFVIFRMATNPLAGELFSAIPIMYSSYFVELQALCHRPKEGATLAAIFSRINLLKEIASTISRSNTMNRASEMLESLTLGEFFQQILAQYPTLHFNTFIQALNNIQYILNESSLKEPWAIRLPLPTGKMLVTGITFWLELIKPLLSKQNVLVQVFWNDKGAKHKPALTLFFKPMPAIYFAYLVDQNLTGNRLFDVVIESQQLNGCDIMTSVLENISLSEALANRLGANRSALKLQHTW